MIRVRVTQARQSSWKLGSYPGDKHDSLAGSLGRTPEMIRVRVTQARQSSWKLGSYPGDD